jgi:hypothetical protein
MCVLDILKKVLDVLNNCCLPTQNMLINFDPEKAGSILMILRHH